MQNANILIFFVVFFLLEVSTQGSTLKGSFLTCFGDQIECWELNLGLLPAKQTSYHLDCTTSLTPILKNCTLKNKENYALLVK